MSEKYKHAWGRLFKDGEIVGVGVAAVGLDYAVKLLNQQDAKLAAIRAALDHCNAQPPYCVVDAIYDFKQEVEGILGKK